MSCSYDIQTDTLTSRRTSELYTLSDLKAIFISYISAKNLINAQEQVYINVAQDDALLAAVTSKNELNVEFLKREEALARLKGHMQSWYEIRVEGRDIVRKCVRSARRVAKSS